MTIQKFGPSSLLAAFFLSGLMQISAAQTLPDAAQVKAYAEQLLDEQKLPADGPGVALLVARGDQLLYRGARGMASIELGVPLSPDQVFRIGSVTKQFAAATLLKLIDEGRAKLDDPLSKFLPDYPKGDTITLAALLNHSSGVKSYTGIPGYMGNPVRRELSTAELVAEFKNQPSDFAPGSGWRYNNSGYVLVGAVIEAITGKSWHQALDESLLRPNKLSGISYPGETRVIKGMVSGYGFDPKLGVVGDGLISMTQPHAAGALVADVDSLWRWNLALHGGTMISPTSYARMTSPEGTAVASRYGYGIAVGSLRGQPRLDHGGGINGFVSSLAWLPDGKVSVVMLRNTTGPGFNMDLVSRKLGAFVIGRPYPAIKPVAVAAESLKALEGVFALDTQQTRTLSLRGGQLFSTRSGGQPSLLVPVGADQFAFADSVARLQIERAADGKVSALKLFQDGDGAGEVWTRSADLPAQVAISLTTEQQLALIGDYASDQLQIKIFKDAQGGLRGQIVGQPDFELKASSPAQLYLTAVDAKLDFELLQGRAVQVTLLQGPARMVMKRQS
ncbi:hypothetical protein BH11PSE10_BH11PSE10_04950 [soil metagenome]